MLYEELWWSQYDTSQIDSVQAYFPYKLPSNDTVEIGLIKYRFNIFKDSTVFGDTTYFKYDSVNNQIVDNNHRINSPYNIDTVFATATLQSSVAGLSPVFKIDPNRFVTDAASLVDLRNRSLYIDFDDGSGFQSISTTSPTHVHVNYSTGGTVLMRTVTVDNQNGDTIDFSQFTFNLFGQQISSADLPDSTFSQGDMEVGVYNPCNTGDPNFEEKFIIFIEGFDFWNEMSIAANYQSKFKETGLAELRNHGYTILIVNWKKPGQSIQLNSAKIIWLLDKLQCDHYMNVDNPHQFVVIGSSMGGLIARHALASMEDKNYNTCRQDLSHNTRLFISLDSPQQGAHVPMAFQELYRLVRNSTGLTGVFTIDVSHRLRNKYDMLYCSAARQMLQYHVSTNLTGTNFTGGNYSPHNDRINLRNQLDNLNPSNGGYPEFCKKMAISNGLLTGEHQLRTFPTLGAAQQGEELLNGEGSLNIRVLGRQLDLIQFDMSLNSVNGSNDILDIGYGIKFWRLVIEYDTYVLGWCPFCTRIRFPVDIDWEFDYAAQAKATRFPNYLPEVDYMPGGRYEYASIVNMFQERANAFSSWFPFGMGPTGGIVTVIDALVTPIDITPLIDINLTTQSPHFCFIPVQSALDYDGGGSVPLDHDIYNENINTKLSRTPFDVIVGEVNGQNGFPQPQAVSNRLRNEFSFPTYNLIMLPSETIEETIC